MSKSLTFERQEREFVQLVNNFSANNGPFILVAGEIKIPNCIAAEKIEGVASHGKEPYADVILKTNTKNYNVSMKGEPAPSLAGGGKEGLEVIIPGFTKKYLQKAEVALRKKFKKGDVIPDIYFPISKSDLLTILKGTEYMGGPIDYMYIGPMDVCARQSDDELEVNGNLISVQSYSQTHSLYIRLRNRRHDQTFEPGLIDKHGYPRILGRSPSKGDIGARVVVTDKPSSNGLLLKSKRRLFSFTKLFRYDTV